MLSLKFHHLFCCCTYFQGSGTDNYSANFTVYKKDDTPTIVAQVQATVPLSQVLQYHGFSIFILGLYLCNSRFRTER